MTFRDGDTIWPHHPDTTVDGDLPVNNRPGDTWYLLVDAYQQDIAWAILNSLEQSISWHIHPAIIEYIAQFFIKYIRTAYELDTINTEFVICPVQTSFKVVSVLDDNVSLKPQNMDMSFSIVPPRYTFTLKNQLQTNFKITRVLDNTRTP